MPVDSYTEKTRRYCFIEYNTTQEPELAKEKSHGYKLGKEYIAVNLLDDFDRFMKVPDEWDPPETKTYTPGENLQQWLTDKERDHFVIRVVSDTEKLKLMSIVIVNMVKVTSDHHEEVIKVGISPSLKESESFKKFLYVIAGCPGDVRILKFQLQWLRIVGDAFQMKTMRRFLMSVDVVGLRCQLGVNRE
ncbi:hypothetical protein IFM89_003469 [Coptis chinensis]|uniref:RRM domain-containing protein n=1 Tax=Coptis chinensis TaxID=261450 RepID=A0A835HCH4_9MAGN|nr:hypothetical protein IFM89_003469 [Coptis chinensis]